MTPSKVIFIPVHDSHTKRLALVRMAQRAFTNHIRLLFFVANEEVARYVDELLWKFPPESFLPHAILSQASLEPIAITTHLQNFNSATILFNLHPDANPLAAQFPFVYDLYDSTHPEKLTLSQSRKGHYIQQGFMVC